MRCAIVAVCCLIVLPVAGSEPGQPLDCSDMIFDEPGLTCRDFMPFGLAEDDTWWIRGANLAVDNEGRAYAVRAMPGQHAGIEVVRTDGPTESRVARIEGNRIGPRWRDGIRTRLACATSGCGYNAHHSYAIQFDPVNGMLLVWLESYCFNGECGNEPYGGGRWIAAIEGFTTLHEIWQSYETGTSSIGFRVPIRPEGFQYADYFDTYYGTLASVGDWSQAQPLQCGYPATAPEVGDYLEVTDPLPTPDPGDGYYYVTAVNYQGQRRYGRERDATGLYGRDPAVLPVCED